MTAEEYRAIVKAVGFRSFAEAGRFFKTSPPTAKRWALKGPPEPVAMMLRLMERLRFTPAYVDDVLSLEPERKR